MKVPRTSDIVAIIVVGAVVASSLWFAWSHVENKEWRVLLFPAATLAQAGLMLAWFTVGASAEYGRTA